MRCAFCGSGLSPYVTPEHVALEICGSCRALRLDPGELEALLGRPSPETLVHSLPKPGTAPVPCGRCDYPELRANALPESDAPVAFDCPRCASFWVRPEDFQRLRQRVRPKRAALAVAGTPVEGAPPSPPATEALPNLSLARRAEVLLLRARERVLELGTKDPAASYLLFVFLGAWAFSLTDVGTFVGSIVGMPFHELGHATASWLNGRFAIPLPFFTFWREERSLSLTLLLLVGSAASAWYFGEKEEPAARVGSWVVGGLVALAWLLLSPPRALEAQILGGFLGEILLAALPLSLYFVRAPAELRWDFWRFFVVLPASLSFSHALVLWTHARSDRSVLPWGSAIGSESDGDLNRLVREFGWTEDGLVALFEGTAALAAALLLGIVFVRLRTTIGGAADDPFGLSERPAADPDGG